MYGQATQVEPETQEENFLVPPEENETEMNYIIVHITGSVENEGIVKLREGARIADAIEEAGGATYDANINNVNLAYKLKDGQKVHIPSNIEEDIDVVTDKSEGIIEEGSTNGRININTASQTELETLTGIGPSMALKIIEYREKNGNFKHIEDIKNVTRHRRCKI